MSPRQQEIIFVNGPTLSRTGDEDSSKARSVLIRRQILDKKTKYRREEAIKRDQLIARRQSDGNHVERVYCSWCRRCNLEQALLGTGQLPPTTGAPCASNGQLILCETHQRLQNVRRISRDRGSQPTAIVSGRMDPFSPLDVAMGPQVDSLVHFALTAIWPAFRCSEYSAQCYQAWMLQQSQNKLLVYSTLWAAAYHREVLRVSYGASDPLPETKEQLYYKGLVLKTLREHVAEYADETWRDSVIMCVLYLAVNDTGRKKIDRDPSPFVAPFVDLQSLSFYGSRDYHALHWGIIQDILRRLGGIHSVKLFGLGWLLSLADLMNAAHSLTKPQYPFVDLHGNISKATAPSLAFPYINKQCPTPGIGFHDLYSLVPPIKSEVVRTFIHLGEYSAVIQWAQKIHLHPETTDQIADTRNQIHHNLFGLPDDSNPVNDVLDLSGFNSPPDQMVEGHRLYLVCRLAAFLYAVHVTFPVPRSSALRAIIVPKLTPMLFLINRRICDALLLWCATVAAIAADGMEEHDSLVHLASELCHDLQITEFSALIMVVQRFAWVDNACRDGCHRLWDKVYKGSVRRDL
ncbi:hypothetical protein BDV25DRAFT_15396 [Aspergillus avenaceus]|uniref:Uncharacterized protein n=1 Tax=Aspergillus avenaceus TaxID=36643 RepID=A0A5N6TQM4_ASPAV|nr:hypothetical protein BDV25DRAFT_15396 [Aspergillus avenaceus]